MYEYRVKIYNPYNLKENNLKIHTTARGKMKNNEGKNVLYNLPLLSIVSGFTSQLNNKNTA